MGCGGDTPLGKINCSSGVKTPPQIMPLNESMSGHVACDEPYYLRGEIRVGGYEEKGDSEKQRSNQRALTIRRICH
ncbi:MAG: hypothetical protein ACE5OW_01960 [Candidatus Bathyarchaeia archaeon]